MLVERIRILPKEFFITSQKKKKILIHYIPIVGGYMVDGYEMGINEWPSMYLRYSLICTLTTIH